MRVIPTKWRSCLGHRYFDVTPPYVLTMTLSLAASAYSGDVEQPQLMCKYDVIHKTGNAASLLVGEWLTFCRRVGMSAT